MKEWNIALEPFQMKFVTSRARFPAMVAAWGTGKTMCGIAKGVKLSEKYPNNLGLIVRKNFTDLKDSTMKDFTRYTGIRVPSSKDVKLPNGSEIMFRHMDELSGIIQNVNLGWFFIEQAEEFDTADEFDKLDGRLRREGCFCQGFIIANTNGHNWIWRRWKNKGGKEYLCDKEFLDASGKRVESGVDVEYDNYASLVEAKTADNPNLPAHFLASHNIKADVNPAHYRRYVLNSWEDVDTYDEVLPYRLIVDSVGKEILHFHQPRRVISCDPAELGNDHTVIYAFEGGKIIDQEITAKKEPMDTAGRIFRMAKKYNSQLVVIDADGLGGPIRSRLSELGVDVMGVRSGQNSDNKEDFKNVKAEMWMNARDMFIDGLVSLPDDGQLIEDLAAHTYTLNSKGQIIICKKDDVKKKLGGRSPDQGDALVLGLYGLTKVGVEPLFDYEQEDSDIADSYSVKTVF
jgi:hypothetical protein